MFLSEINSDNPDNPFVIFEKYEFNRHLIFLLKNYLLLDFELFKNIRHQYLKENGCEFEYYFINVLYNISVCFEYLLEIKQISYFLMILQKIFSN